MEVFKERFERYNIRELEEERSRRFYKDFSRMCAKRCLKLKDSTLTDKEKDCFKNCSVKLFRNYIPIYETFV
jgi:Tim10/DDP family zinc finger.